MKRTVLLMAVFSLVASWPAPVLLAQAQKPNVLFIAVDDLNHWVGPLLRNPQTKTPNLDRLAARGLTFRRAYCAVPACEPSRAALMSGKRPWTTACYANGDKWKQHLTEGEQLTAQFLKVGYHVAGAGKIFHGDQYFPSEWSEYQPGGKLHAHGEGVKKMKASMNRLRTTWATRISWIGTA